jgi:hypothetical protein
MSPGDERLGGRPQEVCVHGWPPLAAFLPDPGWSRTPSEMGVLWSIRQGRAENFFMASSKAERQQKI